MRFRQGIGALAFATLAFITPARAALVDVVWTGTTSFDSNDPLGLFGSPGLIGSLSYTARFRFDTTIGFSNATGESVTGGSFNNNGPTPVVSASITIRGVTQLFGGDYYANYNHTIVPGFGQISTESSANARFANQPGPGAVDQLFQRARRFDNLIFTASLDAPFSYSFGPGDFVDGHFQYFSANGLIASSGNLIPETITISVVAPGVPEPSTWALMAAGFMLLGFQLSRRKSTPAAAGALARAGQI